MTLSTGTRLGPYEILAPLGAGGMGEVWRARDPRLGRSVAIKVLPPEVSADGDRLRRFEKEAQAASSLNHPNIVTIHDIERIDSTSFIVMELVEGKTLREVVSEGPLAVRKLLAIAVQIADGLARAHAARIVHRDLKPENVMVTKDGLVKILDFGLAKLAHPELEGGQLTQGPTVSGGTSPGVVMGTVGYMSPEQASGHPVDFRSDQFSFGSVLYEMATGKAPFRRATAAQTLAAIIQDEPEPIATAAPKIPAPLRWIVERTLAKDAKDRYASTEDLARDLAGVREHLPEFSGSGEAAAMPPRRRSRLLLLVAAAVAALFVAVVVVRSKTPSAPPQRIETSLLPPERWTFEIGASALSPDGSRLLFAARDAGHTLYLWVRHLGQSEAQQLVRTTFPVGAFWSPSGRQIGFFADGKLKVIEATGGAPRTVCDAPAAHGGTWNQDDVILFAPKSDGPLFRVSATGGEATPVTRLHPARKETSHRLPSFLPDGRQFLFLSMTTAGEEDPNSGVYVGSLDSRETRRLLGGYTAAIYAPQGYVFFTNAEGTLIAQSFDAAQLRLSGSPRPIAEGVLKVAGSGPSMAGFSASRNGLLAFQHQLISARIVWFDRSGKEVGSVGPPGEVYPRFSPDGKKVVVYTEDPRTGNDIWIYDLSRAIRTPLTSGHGENGDPIWSPDGRQIVFSSTRTGRRDLYLKDSSGAGKERLLLHSDYWQVPMDWSFDGKFLLYGRADPTSALDLWVLPLSGDRKPFPFLQLKGNQDWGRFSPDGRWIAYTSNESGKNEIYVLPFPGLGERWQVTTGGGLSPIWRRDGKELFYLSGGNAVAVEVKPGSPFQTGAPKPLFPWPWHHPCDVSADGQRFLTVIPDKEARPVPITLIQNWTNGLTP
jgi:Tol biopolymer transport system component